MAKRKFYAVRKGRAPGIYTDWDAASAQVSGFKGAQYKSFPTLQDAQAYMAGPGGSGGGAASASASAAAGPVSATASGPGPSSSSGSGGGGGRAGGGGRRYYAIRAGWKTGVFAGTWPEVEGLVKGYSNALFKGFGTQAEAQAWLGQGPLQAVAPNTAGGAGAWPAGGDAGPSGAAQAAASQQQQWEQAEQAEQQQQQPAPAPAQARPKRPRPPEEAEEAERELMVTVTFDGASRDNPGRAGYGYVVVDRRTQERLYSGCGALPHGTTNNEAEYNALIAGLERALRLGAAHVVAQGDSLLIVNQVNEAWKCKEERLKPLLREALRLKGLFRTAEVQHIYREANAAADELANLAVDVDGAVEALGRLTRAGRAGDRGGVVRQLAEAMQLDDVEGGYPDQLRAAPVLLHAAAPLLAQMMDGAAVEAVEARLAAAGWTEETGGPPVELYEGEYADGEWGAAGAEVWAEGDAAEGAGGVEGSQQGWPGEGGGGGGGGGGVAIGGPWAEAPAQDPWHGGGVEARAAGGRGPMHQRLRWGPLVSGSNGGRAFFGGGSCIHGPAARFAQAWAPCRGVAARPLRAMGARALACTLALACRRPAAAAPCWRLTL